MKILFSIFTILLSSYSYSQENVEFFQKDKTKIEIKAINNFEKLEITFSKNKKKQQIDSIEASLTDKKTYFSIEDYNFDGYKDFAVYRTDDGMGVYTIYQVFIYNPDKILFTKLKMPLSSGAACDEFCDIKVDKKSKTFQSSCRGGAKWHTDTWKFDKNKKLVFLKK
jgi:hypothetical protein